MPSRPTYWQSAMTVDCAPAEPSGFTAIFTIDPFAVFDTSTSLVETRRPFAPMGKGSGAAHAGDPFSSAPVAHFETTPPVVMAKTLPVAESDTKSLPFASKA